MDFHCPDISLMFLSNSSIGRDQGFLYSFSTRLRLITQPMLDSQSSKSSHLAAKKESEIKVMVGQYPDLLQDEDVCSATASAAAVKKTLLLHKMLLPVIKGRSILICHH